MSVTVALYPLWLWKRSEASWEVTDGVRSSAEDCVSSSSSPESKSLAICSFERDSKRSVAITLSTPTKRPSLSGEGTQDTVCVGPRRRLHMPSGAPALFPATVPLDGIHYLNQNGCQPYPRAGSLWLYQRGRAEQQSNSGQLSHLLTE